MDPHIVAELIHFFCFLCIFDKQKQTPLCLFMETVLMSSHAMYYFYYCSVKCTIWSSL